MLFKIRKLSIKKLTLFIFIIMYIIFFIITSINLYSFSSYEFNKTEKLIKNINSNLSEQIEQKLNTLIDISKYPLIIPETEKLNSILNSSTNYTIDDYNFLLYLCQMMLIQNDSINGVYLYSINGNGVYMSRNIINYKLQNLHNKKWFDDSINSDQIVEINTDIKYNDIFLSSNITKDNFITIKRKIIDAHTQETTGLLMLTIPVSEIESILTKDLPFNNQIISIYNNNKNLIVSTNNKQILNYDSYINNNTEKPVIINHSAPYKNIICINKIKLTNWIIINSLPKSSAYRMNSFYLFFFASSLVFCLVLFAIIYIFFLQRIFYPLNNLIENMNNRTEYNLETKFEYNKNDEIGILVTSYNSMKHRIINLINLNYKTKIEQKEFELKQLQNQINPHFIYNTLESIHMMAEINDDSETSTMAEYFGSIIRYSMNRKVNMVHLKDEMKIIDNYIYLQRIRFDTLFTINNMIQDDVLECKIVKMIIQPLIENSIYHGLSECDGNGKIIIQGMRIDDSLVISVSDNGKGIDEINLNLLNEYINDKNDAFKGIALKNINKRLKLNYGNEYGLEIFSIYGKGTSMVLTLPYIID